MSTEPTRREPDTPDDAAPTAAPIRPMIGASPEPGRWGTIGIHLAAGAGWVVAGAMVLGGGVMLWHLLFGDSVGGDVWLGQPAAWVTEETTAADSLPGGEPWTPDMSRPSGRVSATVTVVHSASAPTSTVSSSSSSSSSSVASPPVAQSPTGRGNASTPAAGTLPNSDGSPVTVTTVAPVAPVATEQAAVSSTTSPGTTVEAATTTVDDGDSSSTTIDSGDGSGDGSGGDGSDDDSGGGDGGGGGNSGPGGGGGGDRGSDD